MGKVIFVVLILSLTSLAFAKDKTTFTDDDLDKFKHKSDEATYQYNKTSKDLKEAEDDIKKTTDFINGLKDLRIKELRECEYLYGRSDLREKQCEESVIRKYDMVISEGERRLEELNSQLKRMKMEHPEQEHSK